MSKEINQGRRRFLGTAAMTLAATQLGMVRADAQSSKAKSVGYRVIVPVSARLWHDALSFK